MYCDVVSTWIVGKDPIEQLLYDRNNMDLTTHEMVRELGKRMENRIAAIASYLEGEEDHQEIQRMRMLASALKECALYEEYCRILDEQKKCE